MLLRLDVVVMKIRELYIVLKDTNILFQNWEPVCLDDRKDIKSFFFGDTSRSPKEVESVVSLIVDKPNSEKDIARICRNEYGDILAITLASTHDDEVSVVFISDEVYTRIKPVLRLLKIGVR